jgi:hypothetical protein
VHERAVKRLLRVGIAAERVAVEEREDVAVDEPDLTRRDRVAPGAAGLQMNLRDAGEARRVRAAAAVPANVLVVERDAAVAVN